MYVCSRHVIVILLYTDDAPHYFKYIAYISIFSTNLTKTCQNMYACMANVWRFVFQEYYYSLTLGISNETAF